MATITITVQSLLNTAVYDSYTIDNGQTVTQLKTAINTARGFDSTWYDLVSNETVLDGASTLADLGITSGTALRTHNKIARLATRELRQVAKLNLAQLDRHASGNPRDTYDLSELPTQYSGDTIVDNDNTGGLIEGRPWVGAYDAGLWQGSYNLYWNNNVAFFDTATLISSGIVANFTIPSEATNHSEMYLGYVRPDYTGTWTFTLSSDDASALWIGDTAKTGYTTGNALLTASFGSDGTGTVDLVEGKLYAIRVMFGNGSGPGNLSLTYSHTGQSTTADLTGKVFYNIATNGF